MSSPIADSYTEFFVGYTISYVVGGDLYNVHRRYTDDDLGHVLYIHSSCTPELDFNISDELRPIREYDGTIPNHVYLSTDSVTWDFGDGTTKQGLNVRHRYTTPGQYTIRVLLRDYDGRPRESKYRQVVHVADFVKSEVKWETPNMRELRCDTVPAGSPSHPLTVKTSTSYRYSDDLNALHTVSLYVSGSNSSPGYKTDYTEYKYAQFDPLWKFMSTQSLDPIQYVDITPSVVYLRYELVDMNDGTWDLQYGYYITPNIIASTSDDHTGYVNKSDYYTSVYDTFDERDSNPQWQYTIAGHVGYENIRYLDDIAKVYLSRHQDPVMLFANLQISENIIYQKETTFPKELDISIEDWNVDVLPMKVMFNPATQLSITPTGVPDIIFPPNKYQDSIIGLHVALADDVNASILKSPPYPELHDNDDVWFNADWNLIYAGTDTSVDISLSGRNDTITVPTKGCTSNYIIPTNITGSVQLSASCIVRDFAYANKEVEAYYVANMHTDRIFILRPGYLDKIYTFEPEYTISVKDYLTRIYAQLEEPAEVIGLLSTDALTHYFAIGVDGDSAAWIADTDRDALLKFDRFGNHMDTILLPQDLELDKFETNIVSPITHPGIGETLTIPENAYGVSSVAIDGGNNIWVLPADVATILKYHDLKPGVYERTFDQFPILIDGVDTKRVHPIKIETDRSNNVWVVVMYDQSMPYEPPISPEMYIVLKFSSDGQQLIDPIFLPNNVYPHDLLVDGFDDVWMTNTIPSNNRTTGSVFHISKNGQILKEVKDYIHPSTGMLTQFDKPSQIILDMEDNLWISNRGNELIRMVTDTKINKPQYSVDFITNAGLRWVDDQAAIDVHGRRSAIEALSCDSDNRLVVVNNVSKRIYMFDAKDESRHEWVPVDDTEIRNYNEPPIDLQSDKKFPTPGNALDQNSYHVLQAFGDWTGIKWIQKYWKFSNATRVITGSSNVFDIIPDSGDVLRDNEYFDASENFKSIMLQPSLDDSSNFLNKIITPITGDSESSPTTIGKTIYEKISNFSKNVSDVDIANVTQFYSMCKSLGFDIKDFNYIAPGTIKRLVDLFSISYNKLTGVRDQTELSFDALGQESSINIGKNRGAQLDFDSYMVVAGIPIVTKELFNNKYRVVKPMTIKDASSETQSVISTYPLKDYNSKWGWRLSYPEDEPVKHYYDFFEFVPNTTRNYTYMSNIPHADTSSEQSLVSNFTSDQHTQLEGVIDWSNTQTTINENTSLMNLINPTNNDHIGTPTSSIIETIIERELRKNLKINENI